ncbi:NAD(P)-dependent oxidoreductase [Arthrobacter sp. CG_A4]|uniref:NAD(P)-dependent oxidoreductase n=1 Tax=Arthrobacter sp. CG_A4 TaxID=3071706 RepID=UPI002E0CDDDB|nr:D-3-phosphoglycerate dehydrogenase [Arthrobacter sp. CG_A4]
MSRIVITEAVTGSAYDELARNWSMIREPEAWSSPYRLQQLLADAEAVIVRNRTQVNEEFLRAAPHLKVVARAGVGLDNIDLAAADRAGIVVIAPLGANALSVAEHTLTLALALSKNLIASSALTRTGCWDRIPTQELGGRTWGLLSAGATARATARLARALGMDVIAYDPFVDPDHPDLATIGIRLAPLEDVLSAANVLSIHLPHTSDTHHLLNAERLAMLPPGALVINVGRGEVIDEAALLEALRTGALGGAGLDVRHEEPPIAGELEKHPNVIVTPHVAGITVQAQARIGQILCGQIETILGGHQATYSVGAHATPLQDVAR